MMKVIIGFLLISFAITILVAFLEPNLTTKEKVKLVVCFMTFVILMALGIFMMVGGM